MTIVDILRHRLDDPADWKQVAERVTTYLLKHLRTDADTGVELVTCTVTQLRDKLNYETRLLQPTDDFEAAHAERSVRADEFEDGMGQPRSPPRSTRSGWPGTAFTCRRRRRGRPGMSAPSTS